MTSLNCHMLIAGIIFSIFFVSTGNFTEDEKVAGRESGIAILNQCNIAIYLDSEECNAWIEFFKQDCIKFVNIWKQCQAFK